MSATVAVDWSYRPRTGHATSDGQLRSVRLTRENIRLREENDRLRQVNADLAASAEIWIRLYQAALARAGAAAAARTTRTRQ